MSVEGYFLWSFERWNGQNLNYKCGDQLGL